MSGHRYYGWGGVSASTPARIVAPASIDDLAKIFAGDADGRFLGRGLGRSYGDCALNAGGVLIDGRFLDHFLGFDLESGILDCEAGVSLQEICRLLSPAGWVLPVTPGTQFVTIGGAVANDVHGKNHTQQGSFGNHLLALKVARSNGQVLECTRENNSALFAATIGGLGLTGFIVSAKIQLRPLRSLGMRVNRIPFENLETLFALAAEHQKGWEYHAAWLDPAARCRGGHYIVANHGDQQAHANWPRRRPIDLELLARLPIDWPGPLLMKCANAWYRKGVRLGARRAPAESVLFPLDRWRGWNALYGRRGFYQHQSVLPERDAPAGVDEMLTLVENTGQSPTLAVGKWFGPCGSPGLLSFPTPGFSLAMDFGNRGEPTRRLLDELDTIVSGCGGRLYPAKDAHMAPSVFARGYPQLESFTVQSDPRFASDFWHRMGRAA